MAEGVLASLDKEYKALLAPKLLAEAKAVQVVWARVKGYPAWPAQILNEAAALRRKDLGQERHSKGNSVPVMFFGTVEVAWVKDADVVDFKEGLHQGFFDRKTKPFKLALEQVCEYLALDRKRKAPPKWWCKPPSNGLDEQSDGPSQKVASAGGGGGGKGAAQRQDTAKGSRQRSATPAASSESSSSSDEEQAAPPRPSGKKAAASKAAAAKDGPAVSGKGKVEPVSSTAAPKPRDSSTGRPPRDNGSTAVSASGALQAKKPPSAPTALPSRQPPSMQPAREADAAKDAAGTRRAPTAAASASQQAPGTQQVPKAAKSLTVGSHSVKESEGAVQPRKRLKVESAPAGAVGPTGGTVNSVPRLAPPPPAKRTTLPAEDAADIDPAALKLPAEIRRLAGIRLPALPKKASGKVELSPRQHAAVKAEPAVAPTVPAKAVTGPKVKEEDAGDTDGRSGRACRTSRRAAVARAADSAQAPGAARNKRPRRSRSTSEEDSPSTSGSEDKDEGQSSGEEADSEAAESSSSDSEETGTSDAEDDSNASADAHAGATRALAVTARRVLTRAQPHQPVRDRRGEKQRRLARLAAPEPADRRTSSRLKAAEKPLQALAKPTSAETTDENSSESASDSSEESVDDADDEDVVVEEEDEEEDASAASSSSSDGEEEDVGGKGGSGAKSSGSAEEEDSRLRSGAKRGAPTRARTRTNPARKAAAAFALGRSCESSQPASHARALAAGEAATEEEGVSREQQPAAARNGTTPAPAQVAAAPKAVPLELRRLQNSASAAAPLVDTSEPRTLRERASPARRTAGSTGVTPTHTAATTCTTARRSDKRCSEDGSGASMSPDAERNGPAERSPEELNGGGSGEDLRGPQTDGAQAAPPEAHSIKAGPVSGAEAPLTAGSLAAGGVPVRRKPPSLGLPANGRQLPAIVPARAVLRSLTSKREPQSPSGTLPVGQASAGTSAAGALTPMPVCVTRRSSMGPPTRRALESGADAPVSFTDLPDAVADEAEADAKHASSPDVAAAGTATCEGPLPRSPEPASLDEVGQDMVPCNALGAHVEGQPQAAEPSSAVTVEQVSEAAPQAQQDEPASQSPSASQEARPSAAPPEDGAAEAVATPSQGAPTSGEPATEPVAVRREEGEKTGQVPPSPQADAKEAGNLAAEGSQEPQATTADPTPLPDPAQGPVSEPEPQPASEPCTQGKVEDEPGPSVVVESPALTCPDGEHIAPIGSSPARPADERQQEQPGTSPSDVDSEELERPKSPTAGQDMEPAVESQGVSGGRSRSSSRPPSPMREDGLLAEEQLPDHVDDKPVEMQVELGRPEVSCAAAEPASGPACSRPEPPAAVSGTITPLGLLGQPAHPEHAALDLARVSASLCGGTTVLVVVPQPVAPMAMPAAASCDAGAASIEAGAGAAARVDARELEELGEVAATLAGLQSAEVPWSLPARSGPHLPCGGELLATAVSASVDGSSLDRQQRNRVARLGYGRERSAVSRDSAPAASNASGSSGTGLHGFRWPQPEPLLPTHDQSFSLPRDWLVTRPPRYEPIKRNTWLSRAKPKRLPKDEISICACRAPPLSPPGELQRMGCGPNCLNRLSSILCDPKMCPCGDLCSNRSLHLLRPPKTEAFLTENRGWGVRAMEPVYKGGFIIEYAGEVIDDRELGRRMDHARMNGEPHFYIMEMSAGLYIDARRKGNTARLINSSCEPNCETQKWHDAATGEIRVGIFATRDIVPGEELVYDYFFSTYGAMKQSAASFICMCGSKNCRGTMDLHPEKRRDLGRRVEVFWDADGQYYRAVIVAYHPTSRKHTVMYEDGGTEKLSLEEVPHRWLDDDPTRTSPQKPDAQRHADRDPGAAPAAAQPLAQPQQRQKQDASTERALAAPLVLQQSHERNPESRDVPLPQQRQVEHGGYDSGTGGSPNPLAEPVSAPRGNVDSHSARPTLGSCSADGAAHCHAALGKHALVDGDLHLPLKKRQKMMVAQQLHSAGPSSGQQDVPHSGTTGGLALPGVAPPGAAETPHPTSSGVSGDVLAGGRRSNNSSGGADSGGADGNALCARTSYRPQLSGTGSGRVSGVAADEDANDDLDSLLEAAEAVAALRTAPIAHPPNHVASGAAPDIGLPIQPRHIRSGPAGSIAMVQTAKVTSPRHLAAVHRAGPPNGLPPHGGSAASRPSATGTAHPSSSSSGLPPHHLAAKQHPLSGWASGGHQQGSFQQEGHQAAPYDRSGRNGQHAVDGSGAAAGPGRENGTNGFGNGRDMSNGSGGGSSTNREDLLWRLVGIEKPKDLLPLFAGGCSKSREADKQKSDLWIAPSHPYGKLLRALEASELLPHADQLRQYAQQQQQQQNHYQQQHRYLQGQPQAHAQVPQATQTQAQPQGQPAPQSQPLPQLPAPQPQAAAASASAAMEALALSAWQHAAVQQHTTHQHVAQHAAHPAMPAASFGAHVAGLDGGAASIAALLHAQQQQQQHAAAAAAAAAALAASAGQLQPLGHSHALQAHNANHATAAAAAAAVAAASLAGGTGPSGQQLAAQHLAAGGWPHGAQGQHAGGHILQDLVHLYMAQHAAAPHHQMLAAAGMAAAGGPPRCA